jgi:hypothetical protein
VELSHHNPPVDFGRIGQADGRLPPSGRAAHFNFAGGQVLVNPAALFVPPSRIVRQ